MPAAIACWMRCTRWRSTTRVAATRPSWNAKCAASCSSATNWPSCSSWAAKRSWTSPRSRAAMPVRWAWASSCRPAISITRWTATAMAAVTCSTAMTTCSRPSPTTS
ncbi:hypothetical protein G6F60_014707 [Rhizopus arrhizus]|nr:hypothetical protein G6F60_014707 [Rhizopus arrhizus]